MSYTDRAPDPERVAAIAEHVESLGAYAQAREIASLGRQRDELAAALRDVLAGKPVRNVDELLAGIAPPVGVAEVVEVAKSMADVIENPTAFSRVALPNLAKRLRRALTKAPTDAGTAAVDGAAGAPPESIEWAVRPVPFIEELRIEGTVMPGRRGALYREAADRFDQLSGTPHKDDVLEFAAQLCECHGRQLVAEEYRQVGRDMAARIRSRKNDNISIPDLDAKRRAVVEELAPYLAAMPTMGKARLENATVERLLRLAIETIAAPRDVAPAVGPSSDYIDSPHYRVNMFAATVRAIGLSDRAGRIYGVNDMYLTLDDLEAVIRDAARAAPSAELDPPRDPPSRRPT